MAQPAKPILTLAVLICSFLTNAQDYSVGINTNNPNPNAVLHLVAPNGDQGLLIPQLTTSQRLQMDLGTVEDGLLVYDNVEGQFFYWHADAWHPLGSVSGTGDGNATDELQQLTKSDNTVTLSKSGGSFTDEVDDADADPSNELQTLSRSGNTISLSDGGSFTLTEGNPVAGQSIQWDGENWVPLTPSTAQSLTLDGSQLSISDANTVDLAALDDGDGDSLNELQTLTITDDQLSLSKDGSVIDLAPYKILLTEEQVDSYVGNNGYLEAELDPTVPDAIKDGIDWTELTGIPDFSAYLDNTDNQDLELTGDVLSLTGDDTSVDLTAYLDNTDAQDLTLSGTELTLSGDATPVDLSTFLDNTDNQELSLSENSLSLSGGATSVDLTPYLDNTDNQDLSFIGTTLSLTDGGSIDLASLVNDADADPGNEIQDLVYLNDSISLSSDPDGNSVYIFNGDFADLQGVPDGLNDGDDTRSDAEIRFVAYGDQNIRQQLDFNTSSGELSLSGSLNSALLSDWDKDISKDNEIIEQIGYTSDDTLFIYEAGILHKVEIATTSSDQRLKKNITPINNALSSLEKISGYNYYLKSDTDNQFLKTGVIAQEVEKVFPSIVKERDDGYKGVTYHELIPILIEALKEQQALIDNLKSEVATLQESGGDQEERITALEGKLELIMNLMTK